MSVRREGVAACAFEDSQGFGQLLAIGGSNGTGILATCEQATCTMHVNGKDSDLNHFFDLPDMPVKRSNAAACVLAAEHSGDPCVVAIGGFTDAGAVLDRVDTLGYVTNAWDSITPMHSARAMHGSCVHANRVFVAGGTDGKNALNTVESYDSREGRWRHHVPFKHARVGATLGYLDDRLTLVGGRCYHDSIAISEFQSTERAMARQDPTYKTARIREYPDCLEVLDLRMPQWEQVDLAPAPDRAQGVDRVCAAYAVF
jgi:hypothetical protein